MADYIFSTWSNVGLGLSNGYNFSIGTTFTGATSLGTVTVTDDTFSSC
jgi:hypothetical protein